MVVLYVTVALLVFSLTLSYVCYYKVFYSPQKHQNDITRLPVGEQYEVDRDGMIKEILTSDAIEYRAVSIRSRDGLELKGRYYHTCDGAPFAICFHGYRATAIRDFSGGLKILLGMGMNVLLIDERAQGASRGHTITFGIKERWDCLDWISFILNEFGQDSVITLYGISMGAATVLMASELGMPDNVKGIVADCPYDTPKTIICKVCRDLRLPDKLLYPFITAGALLFGHFRLWEANAKDAVKNSDIPILIIHGEDDRYVPCEMSRTIAASNPERVTLHTFPNAGHGISYIIDKPRYISIVTEFVKSVI